MQNTDRQTDRQKQRQRQKRHICDFPYTVIRLQPSGKLENNLQRWKNRPRHAVLMYKHPFTHSQQHASQTVLESSLVPLLTNMEKSNTADFSA